MKLIGTLHLYIRPPYIVSTPRQSTQFTFSPKHFNPHLRHQIPDDNLDPSTLFDHSLRFDALDHLQPSSVDQSAVFVALFNSLERFRAPRSHRDIFKNSHTPISHTCTRTHILHVTLTRPPSQRSALGQPWIFAVCFFWTIVHSHDYFCTNDSSIISDVKCNLTL
jgi:hypothetical protein